MPALQTAPVCTAKYGADKHRDPVEENTENKSNTPSTSKDTYGKIFVG